MGSADPIKTQNATPLKMGTKMKGFIKGFKSKIFDDDKQPEIQIGAPTDVKHVAHIGCDGPAVESPSWMRDFEAPTESQSGPLDMTGAPRETPEVKRVSEDSSQRKGRKDHGSHRSTRSEDGSHRSTRSEEGSRDLPVLPRSNRNRHHSMEMDPDSSDSSTKPRRRHHKGRRSQDQTLAEDSNSKPDVPKRSSRPKKSKEESSGGGSSKPNNSELGTEESA